MGLDWTRLHAALNDLPAALLLAAVLFDLLGAINKRASLRSAGFWCLIFGTLGGGLAALAGEMAEIAAPHSTDAHALLETHETFAWVVLALFGVLTGWRLVRRSPGAREQSAFSAAAVIAVGLLVFTSKLGGTLVFEHGAGISDQRLESIQADRRGPHAHEDGEEPEHEHHGALPADTSKTAPHDSTDHRH